MTQLPRATLTYPSAFSNRLHALKGNYVIIPEGPLGPFLSELTTKEPPSWKLLHNEWELFYWCLLNVVALHVEEKTGIHPLEQEHGVIARDDFLDSSKNWIVKIDQPICKRVYAHSFLFRAVTRLGELGMPGYASDAFWLLNILKP